MEFDSKNDGREIAPEVSVDQYVRKKQVELSEYVSGYKTIYLDTNFWLTLRDVVTGELKDAESIQYYDLVTSLAKKGTCIFPISGNTFAEILKSDIDTLDHVVYLIDTLSQGVSIMSYDERVRMELMYFIYDKLGKDTYLPNEIVWTKLVYSLGYLDPVNDNIDPSLDAHIRKSFFDHMWQTPLCSIVAKLKDSGKLKQKSFLDNSAKLNEGKFAHAHENKSFKQMFLSELAGMLDVYKPVIQDAMLYIYEKETGVSPSIKDIESSNNCLLTVNMIYNLFRLNKITTELPSYRITSGLYAAVRWDTNQKFHKNDIVDIGHASAALPYCDYYFSERKFAHLITQKQMSYNKVYDCQVCRNIKSAITVLSELHD
ncbi:MAG: hypothetical protein OQK32_08875 [Gammaproteobacteria bacterium]|nr:hypothetical protein [Gammaproteobacteria bacterium]MCW8922523.1 hypothetical protein [Gammaproteobacteria bacterium]